MKDILDRKQFHITSSDIKPGGDLQSTGKSSALRFHERKNSEFTSLMLNESNQLNEYSRT